MEPTKVQYPEKHPVSSIISKMRAELLTQGFVFGALFLGELHSNGINFGLFFSDQMPIQARKQMLDDLESSLDAARKLL